MSEWKSINLECDCKIIVHITIFFWFLRVIQYHLYIIGIRYETSLNFILPLWDITQQNKAIYVCLPNCHLLVITILVWEIVCLMVNLSDNDVDLPYVDYGIRHCMCNVVQECITMDLKDLLFRLTLDYLSIINSLSYSEFKGCDY